MNKRIWILISSLAVISIGLFLFRPSETPPIESEVYHIGLLQMAPTVATNMDGFRAGMEALGYLEGENVTYTYLDAEGDVSLLDEYARRLVELGPDLIFVNTSPATRAIKEATKGTDIPVVYSMVADPLGAGFIETMRSSGNNLVGTSCAYIDVAPKRLEVLMEIDPTIERVLIFYRPADDSGRPCAERIVAKGEEIGIEVISVPVEKKEEIRDHLTALSPGDVDAIMDPGDSMVSAALTEWGIDRGIELKAIVFMLAEIEAQKGALASYGVDYVDLGRQSAPIAGKILSGVKPSNIPSEMPRKWLFSVNLETAAKIGLEIPESVINRADIIIEEQ